MSAPPQAKGQPITDKAQMVAYIESGCKARKDWRIGTEHEKFGFTFDDLKQLPYHGEASIEALLNGLAEQYGWQRVIEGNNVIALLKDACSITLEPGGQFELSGAPLETIHETCNEVHTHLHQVRTVAEPKGIGMLGLGFQPKWRRDQIHWMPKGRYKIMREYMPKKGNLGLDMMLRSCTVQVNLDYASEADMVKKFRVSLALQPIATALFANSPFTEGKPNGYLSYRSHLWTDTDPERCGTLPFVFEDGMGFERYVDHVLDVPMYFVYRDGKYLDASGLSFRDFLAGRLEILPGEIPTTADWSDHLSTLFPEVRLKKFLEMRGADGGPWKTLCALPAFWVGLLYNGSALDAAWDLVKDWDEAERQRQRDEVPRLGLKAPCGKHTILDVAREAFAIAESGLKARSMTDSEGNDERMFLAGPRETLARGTTPADELLAAYHGPWHESVDPVFQENAY
ncbi:MAG: glutamate--cysteine ligase [Pseudomonadota bacterium]